MRDLTNVFAAICGGFWSMPEDKIEAMREFLETRSSGAPFTAEEIRARVGERQQRSRPTSPAKSTAVIPIFGVLSHRAHMVQNISGPGGTSTELLGQEFDAAMDDDDIGTIVFDVDSPGGNVQGIQELASKIYAARGKKRIVAIANATMASAAYHIGSAADELVVTPSADVGAIGVYGIHTDTSRRDANVGVTRTVIKAGRYKAEGVYSPLSSEAIAHHQRRVDEIYGQFLQAVATHRGVSPELVRDKFGEGRTVSAQQAVALGMADRIATYDDVIDEVTGRKTARSNGKPARAAADDSPALVATVDVTADIDPLAVAERIASAVVAPLDEPGAHQPTPGPEGRKENPVEEKTTGAPTNGAAAVVDLAAERKRVADLTSLANRHGRTFQELEGWINAGTTVSAVQDEILKAYGDRAVPVRVGADRATQQPFGSLGEQLCAIAMAGTPGQSVDPRLRLIAGPSGANISDNASGGYLLQPQYSDELMKKVFEKSPVPGRCSRTSLGVGSDRLVVRTIKEDSRATGSRWGGVRVYRRKEADTVTASKISFGEWECKAESLMGKAFVTNEALADAPSLQSIYEEGFTNEFDFKLTDEIIRGTGAGECLGILNAPALVTVAKEGGQGADTLVPQNIVNMWAQMWGRSRSNAVWLINQELEPQLHLMTLGTGTVQLIYMPPGGLSVAPYGTLYGRPVLPIEHCSAIGDVGDIMLVDLDQYKLVDKDGVKSDVSIHVRFEYDETCFKWTMRINGQPKWEKALTPYKGAKTLSPFVTLEAR